MCISRCRVTPHIYYGAEGSVDIADEIARAKKPLVPEKTEEKAEEKTEDKADEKKADKADTKSAKKAEEKSVGDKK